MTAWILATAAIAALLATLIAELLRFRPAALAGLAATCAFQCSAFALWHEPWGVVGFAAAALFFAFLAAFILATPVARRKLPAYVVGSDDEDEA